MSSIIFFILACLGPMTIMCDNARWTPETVPWPSQQCVDRDPQSVGTCTIPDGEVPAYRRRNVCAGLSCAVPRNDSTYELRIGIGKPIDGTLCGIMQACRKGRCENIDIDHIPTMTGMRDTYVCRPIEAYLPTELKSLFVHRIGGTKRPGPPRKYNSRGGKQQSARTANADH